jgi:bifunctional DNA-binding transcriptional regulator/antitoxin component of YhaV-PrlF toxin-antitoxin module
MIYLRRIDEPTQSPYSKESLLSEESMLAKMTSKNQLTLPKAVTDELGSPEYFEIESRGGQLILTPVRLARADAVRAKLTELNITERDIADAVKWARRKSR